MEFKRLFRVALATVGILLIPLIATQFSDEVKWNAFDFVVAGIMLLGTGLAYEYVAGKGGSLAYRAGTAMAVGASLLMIWVNLAVGIIGNEDNPANTLHFGVLLVEFFGIMLARFQARGMARALLATALAMALVPGIAYLIWRPAFDPGLVQVLFLHAFFVALFTASGLLFLRSAQTQTPQNQPSI